MAKDKKVSQKSGSRHDKTNAYSLQSIHSKITKDSHHKKQNKATEKKEWRETRCSVCMEYPHNAVLLLCSSHHKGCRSYMCATSSRYSNCLEQYKKAYTKVNQIQREDVSLGSDELLCPLCRGQVKGWTVVKRARRYFNSKKRNCSQDNCSCVGSYKDLRKHVRAIHPSARPREVDPSLVKEWKKRENETELRDVISTINSTMPGAIVMGDYVIERNNHDMNDYGDDFIFQLGSRNPIFRRGYDIFDDDVDVDSDDDDDIMRIQERVRRHVPRIALHRHGRRFTSGLRRRRPRNRGEVEL